MSRIAVSPADQELARLDVLLAERLGEEIDPRVVMIARADLAVLSDGKPESRMPHAPSPHKVWLDTESGEVVTVSDERVKTGNAPGTTQPSAPTER